MKLMNLAGYLLSIHFSDLVVLSEKKLTSVKITSQESHAFSLNP